MLEYFQFLGTDIHTVQAITVRPGPYFTTIVVEYADEQGSAFTHRALLGISLELLVDGIIGKEPFVFGNDPKVPITVRGDLGGPSDGVFVGAFQQFPNFTG